MRKSLAGSLNGDIGWGALRITLSISINNYSTKSKKQGRKVRTAAMAFAKSVARPFIQGYFDTLNREAIRTINTCFADRT
ncbi:MAG: hypothetical protein L0287_27380, partial [Anaerolineae bacterium]|nr:hypothetical protein [Anaerolineae bacterium]